MDPLLLAQFCVIGFLTGILSGLFGVGGGFILVPLLMLARIPVHIAIGTSLGYVTCTSMSGAYTHFCNRNVYFGPATWIIMAGAFVFVMAGARINSYLDPAQLKVAFAFLILITGVGLFIRPSGTSTNEEFRGGGHWMSHLTLGAFIGTLSGIFGVGGGFFLVPAQVLIMNMPIKLAVGTSLFIIILSSAVGAITHALQGNINPVVLVPLVIGGIPAAFLGASLVPKIASKHLQYGFTVLLLCTSGYMLYAAL
jgi:uncharacterized membrane protein YfcA